MASGDRRPAPLRLPPPPRPRSTVAPISIRQLGAAITDLTEIEQRTQAIFLTSPTQRQLVGGTGSQVLCKRCLDKETRKKIGGLLPPFRPITASVLSYKIPNRTIIGLKLKKAGLPPRCCQAFLAAWNITRGRGVLTSSAIRAGHSILQLAELPLIRSGIEKCGVAKKNTGN